jgi:hypothetical protein
MKRKRSGSQQKTPKRYKKRGYSKKSDMDHEKNPTFEKETDTDSSSSSVYAGQINDRLVTKKKFKIRPNLGRFGPTPGQNPHPYYEENDENASFYELSIVKTKSGGYSLKQVLRFESKSLSKRFKNDHDFSSMTKTNFDLYEEEEKSKQDSKNDQEEIIHYFPTKGLIQYFGNNFIWDSLNSELVNVSGNASNNYYKPYKPKKNTTSSSSYSSSSTSIEHTFKVTSQKQAILKGSMIHKELESYLTIGPKLFKKVHPSPDPMTIAILEALGKEKYIGLCAEYPVWFEVTKEGKTPVFTNSQPNNDQKGLLLASSVDLICFDTINKKLVLIEVKTGYGQGRFFHQFFSKQEKSAQSLKAYGTQQDNKKEEEKKERISEELHYEYQRNQVLDIAEDELEYTMMLQLLFDQEEEELTKQKKQKSSSSSPSLKAGHLLGEFDNLKDSPINRAKIQLCAYMYFFRKFLNEDCIGRILHCDGSGTVAFYDINEGFYVKYSKMIMNKLQSINV